MDIGDVLVTMSLDTTTTIPSKTLRTILTSPTWGRYECGKLAERECYRLVAEEHNLDIDEVTRAFNQDIRGSITLNQPLFAYLRQLKSELGPALRLYVMSNISQPDIELLLAKHPDEWAIFEEIFPSSKAGMRKPRLGFYRHALDSIGADPRDVVFVDDKAENVLTAKSFGMHGVVFKQLEDFRRVIRCLVCNPISRGIEYLHAHNFELDAGKLGAIALANGITSMRALESLKEWRFADRRDSPQCEPMSPLDVNYAPELLDVDAIALKLLAPEYDQKFIHATMDAILELRDEDGIIQTFVDSCCGKADPVVCANVLALFYSQGRGSELKETQAWVFDVLKHRSYIKGTCYYPMADSFLYAVSRLFQFCRDKGLHRSFKPILVERLQERIGLPGNVAELTLRILACAHIGTSPAVDVEQLLSLQLEDGSWTWPCKIDSRGQEERCLATALALECIGYTEPLMRG